MAQFTIDIPDELLPALVVEFSLVQGSTTATTPEEYFQDSIVETVRQRAEAYQVGPYYVGPVDPQFRADGLPFGYVDPDPELEFGLEAAENTLAGDELEPEELLVGPDAEVLDAPVVEEEVV